MMFRIIETMTVTINETRLCGPAKFVVWNNTEDDFGKCFQNLVLIFPTQAGVYIFLRGGGTIKVFGGLGENMIKDLRKKGNNMI